MQAASARWFPAPPARARARFSAASFRRRCCKARPRRFCLPRPWSPPACCRSRPRSAVILGADVGSAIAVRVLYLDLSFLPPLLFWRRTRPVAPERHLAAAATRADFVRARFNFARDSNAAAFGRRVGAARRTPRRARRAAVDRAAGRRALHLGRAFQRRGGADHRRARRRRAGGRAAVRVFGGRREHRRRADRAVAGRPPPPRQLRRGARQLFNARRARRGRAGRRRLSRGKFAFARRCARRAFDQRAPRV